jgi:hypothetical protein
MLVSPTELARAAVEKGNEAVSRAALAAVRPLYRNVGSKPEQIGTVTFVSVDGSDYILTAAHVVDHHKASTLHIGHSRLQDLTLSFRSTVAPNGDRLKDRWDFAFAHADPQWRENGIVPLDISDIPDMKEALIFTVVGYPNSSNKRVNHKERSIRPTQRRHSSLRLPATHPVYATLRISFDTHLAIGRDPKQAVSGDEIVRPFEPRGMSGGLIFGLLNAHKASTILFDFQPIVFPAALFIERCEKHRALFGPSLRIIADEIRVNRYRAPNTTLT